MCLESQTPNEPLFLGYMLTDKFNKLNFFFFPSFMQCKFFPLDTVS